MNRYEKEEINKQLVDVCVYYLGGPGKEEGDKRIRWQCPGCGKDGNFAANLESMRAGCWKKQCRFGKFSDAVGMIAVFEDLQCSGDEYVKVLRRGYEILGLELEDRGGVSKEKQRQQRRQDTNDESRADTSRPNERNGKQPRGSEKRNKSIARAEHSGAARTGAIRAEDKSAGKGEHGAQRRRQDGRKTEQPSSAGEIAVAEDMVTVEDEEPDPEKDYTERPVSARQQGKSGLQLHVDACVLEESRFPSLAELHDAVFEAVLKLCPLEKHEREMLEGRGLDEATIEEGRFGSISKKRAQWMAGRLARRFSKEELLATPGFFVNGWGKLSFTLTGEYLLIPYHDADMLVRTLEGRAATPEQEEQTGKYVSLRNSGNHLYVFPGRFPERLEAFCEGPFGAIVAARSGIAVGAIQGFRRHRASTGANEPREPLPELAGVDFLGRRIPYVPDLDDPPRPEVLGEAPEAARWLVEEQNGEAAIAVLPRGKDLDEWLLTVPEPSRRAAMSGLLAAARPLGGDGEGSNGRGGSADPRKPVPKPSEGGEGADGQGRTRRKEAGGASTEKQGPKQNNGSGEMQSGAKTIDVQAPVKPAKVRYDFWDEDLPSTAPMTAYELSRILGFCWIAFVLAVLFLGALVWEGVFPASLLWRGTAGSVALALSWGVVWWLWSWRWRIRVRNHLMGKGG